MKRQIVVKPQLVMENSLMYFYILASHEGFFLVCVCVCVTIQSCQCYEAKADWCSSMCLSFLSFGIKLPVVEVGGDTPIVSTKLEGRNGSKLISWHSVTVSLCLC